MRLTCIKFAGFKSFVDPTHFQVPGQLVGVVGPNGCGKSNIIDAVRWVLGESRASELRGESMQDVIFNGSTQRKPAGRASVELVFDNSLGRASGQWGLYAEIAVKRTLTRDGTSTYFINNQVVRRRDIQDIFMGTGLGPRAYAIIGQGMIARIIESRPEELRVFLEEAAGVSKYKERRRETENRLKDTRENLLRLDDIQRELGANLGKLEEQAAIATRYHALLAEQDEKQKLLWLLRKNEASSEQTRIFKQIEQAQLELEERSAQFRHLELELEQMRQTHYAAGDRLHQAQGQLYQTNAEIGSLEAQIRFVVESRTRLQAQLQQLQTKHDQWLQQAGDCQGELNESEIQLQELGERRIEAEMRAQTRGDDLPELEQRWRAAQEGINDSRTRVMQAQQKIDLEAARQNNVSGMLASLATRRERLAQEKNGLGLPDEQRLENLKFQFEEKTLQQEEAQFRRDELESAIERSEQKRRSAQEIVNHEEAQLTRLDARLQALRQLQENVQTQGKIAPWLKKHEVDSLHPLWQRLSVDAGWEKALEAVLRERVSGLEISNIDWARAFLNDMPPGKLTFFSTKTALTATAPLADTSGFAPFIERVRVNDPGLRNLLALWLDRLYCADDEATAWSRRSELPAGAFFVTRQGHLFGAASLHFYASDSEQAGMLERQQEIDNLGKQIKVQQFLLDEARSKLVRREAALTQATREVQEVRARLTQIEQTRHSLQIESVRQNEARERYRQRSNQIETDLAEITAAEEEQQQIQLESEAVFEQLDMALANAQEAHENLQTQFIDIEQQLTQARERLRDEERAAQDAVYAEKAQRTRIDELKRTITTAREQSVQLDMSMGAGRAELAALDDQMAQEGLQSLLDRRIQQERILAEACHELDQIGQTLRQHEESRSQIERPLQPMRDQITELQLKEQASRLNQEQYAAQLVEAQADEAALREKLDPETKPAWLQGEVTRLGNAIAALGAVNLAALDELEQASERKRFLDAQTNDLQQAIETLEDAIRKIDRETRELLKDTFDRVNSHFGELFPILFGGGQAKLVMTGDEILDAGVQVMAQPPGKKNATIHLLSGGEKALTATALVFSMFQLNPAPFCLLDEVDAPLDDANTERFCKMVQKMSDNTQFLFISHNKIAMEMAEQLIGVTMQEQGVSRIVAVDMAGALNMSDEVKIA